MIERNIKHANSIPLKTCHNIYVGFIDFIRQYKAKGELIRELMRDRELTQNILQSMAIIEKNIKNIKDITNFGGATPDDLAQKLSVDKTTISDKLKELTAEGHILFNEEIGLAFLEKSGRQLLTDLKYKSKNIGSQNITFNAPVNNSNIIQGDNASATITVNFLSALQREIESSTLPEEERKTWLSRIKEISSHPILASFVAKALEKFAKS